MNNKAFMKFLTFAAAAALSALALSGCSQGGGPDASPSPSAAPGKKAGLDGIVINEVVSVNSLSHIDPDYGAADWVELKNTAAEASPAGGLPTIPPISARSKSRMARAYPPAAF